MRHHLAALLALAPLAACGKPAPPAPAPDSAPAAAVEADTAPAAPEADTAAPAPVPAAPAGVFPYAGQRLALPNGRKALLVPMPSDGLVSFWSIVRSGSRDEVEPGVTGFAHFFEHMMFRGSENFPGAEYDKVVAAIGADANAYTTDDYTAYHLSFVKEDLGRVLEIEADRFLRLRYDEPGFKTEAGAVYGEYRKGRTSPWSVLFEALQNTAFDQHTYKHTTMGFEADIARMPEQFAYSQTFFERFYRPENVVLVVTGDFDPAEAERLITARYGDWKPGYVAPAVPAEPEQTAPRRVDVPFDGQTLPILAVVFKGDALRPDDATMIAAQTLGELAFGETSALYQRLVLDEQRVESLESFFDDQRDPGLWGVVAMVKDPADVRAVEAELLATVAKFRAEPVSAERLDAVRSHLKYRFLNGMTTPDAVASRIAQIVAITGDVTAIDTRYATLDRVTPADVQAAAAKYLTLERSTVATLHTKDQPIPEAAAVPAVDPAPAPATDPSAVGAPGAAADPAPAADPAAAAAPAADPAAVAAPAADPAAVAAPAADPAAVAAPAAAPPGAPATDPSAIGAPAADPAASPSGPKGVAPSGPAVTPGRVTAAPVLLPVPSEPLVAFHLYFRVGSQDDPPGKEGLAALTASLVAEGSTRSLSYEQILARLFPMAAGYGASVDREMTVVTGQVHKDHVAAFSELLVAALVEPAFTESDFARKKSEVRSYLENQLRFSSDEELGKAVLYRDAFAGTPYAHPEEGTVASLDALTVEDVRAFHAAHYTRDNVVIGLGGGYPAELPDALATSLGRLPAGERGPAPALTVTPPAGRRVTIVQKPGPSTAISFGHPVGVHRGSREFYALWLAVSWLGEHRNSVSHLYQVIREERGMNYGDYAYIEAFPQGGHRQVPPTGVARREHLFEVWIRPVPEAQALFALRAAVREVERLAQGGLTAEQFEAHRRFLGKYVLHFAETTAERLGYAVDDRFFGLSEPGGHLALARKTFAELTLAEVNAALARYVSAANLHIALVTEHAEAMAEALAGGAPSPMTYPAGVEKSAATLAEDKLIEAWPLAIPREAIRIEPVQEVFAKP